jgi:hypothetical protein
MWEWLRIAGYRVDDLLGVERRWVVVCFGERRKEEPPSEKVVK